MNRKELLIVSVLIVIVAVASSLVTWIVVSLSTTKPIPVTVIIGYTTGIGVYWDTDCTIPAESIGFDVILPGQISHVELHLKNEGSVSIQLRWFSNCSEQTDEKITDHWTTVAPPEHMWHTMRISDLSLDPGETLTTYYAIEIASDCPSGAYDWFISL